MAFCAWLLSPSTMISNFIHDVVCIDSTLFFFIAKLYSIAWLYDILFVYLSVNGHVGYSSFSSIMSNVAMNILKNSQTILQSAYTILHSC